jgi:hypothetical protein
MNKLATLCVLTFLCLGISLKAQKNAPVKKTATEENTIIGNEKTLEERTAGTYVMIVTSDKLTSAITTETLQEIEKRRDETQEVIWVLNPFLTIKILAKSIISAPGFDPKKYQQQ